MRLLSVDILRTLAIVMMVLVHFVENLAIGYGLEAPQSVASHRPWWLPVSLAAPLFTLLSGVSYRAWVAALKTRDVPDEVISKRSVRRGLFLIGLGFFFNVFVWLPEDTFNWDILTFIGSALIFLNVLRSAPAEILPIVAFLIAAISPTLRMVADYPAFWTNSYFDYDFTLTDVIQGYLATGYFPLFPWLLFPVAGYAIAPLVLPEQHDRNQLPSAPQFFRLGILLLGAALLVRFAPWDAPLGSELCFSMFPASTRYLLSVLSGGIGGLFLLHALVDLRPASEGERRQSLSAALICRVISRHSLSLYLLHHVVHIWPLWVYGLATTGEPTSHWQTLMPAPAAAGLAVLFCAGSVPLFLLIDHRGWPTVETMMRWVAD